MEARSSDPESLWAALMAGEPEVSEHTVITSADINRQTAERFAPAAPEVDPYDELRVRFSGPSIVDHQFSVRSASRAILAIQESLSSVGASFVAHLGRAGRWPAEILAATELKFTPRVVPGSLEFALVHVEEQDNALLPSEHDQLFDRSAHALLKLFNDLADDSLAEKSVTAQLAQFGPRASKHLFDFAQVLVAEGISVAVELEAHDGEIRTAGVGRRSAAYLKELATASATSKEKRLLAGQLITVSEVDRQGLLLDDGTSVLLEADKSFQDALATYYRKRVQAEVEETLTINLSTGAESRSYVLHDIGPIDESSLAAKADIHTGTFPYEPRS